MVRVQEFVKYPISEDSEVVFSEAVYGFSLVYIDSFEDSTYEFTVSDEFLSKEGLLRITRTPTKLLDFCRALYPQWYGWIREAEGYEVASKEKFLVLPPEEEED